MPTIFRQGPYRFFFYSCDRAEPPHVHVERDDCIAKIWLDPLRLASSGGFGRREISAVLAIVQLRRLELLEAWNAYFND
jgi:hypothetical protein